MASLGPEVRVFTDTEALSRGAADLFVQSGNAAMTERDRYLVCLSGGKTPERFLGVLTEVPYRGLVDWSRVHVFWGDERCVPSEDLNSNYRMARELLLHHVPVPAENVHRVRTELEPVESAEAYALVLRGYASPPLEWPRFDLVYLGLGQDGHTASLFPGPVRETGKSAIAVEMPNPKGAAWRVTLTSEVFNAARRIAFLVQGAGKARVVSSVLYGDLQPEKWPAQRIHPTDGELIWMLDAGAAARE